MVPETSLFLRFLAHMEKNLFQHFKDKAYCTEQEKNSSQDWYQVGTDICSCDLSGER